MVKSAGNPIFLGNGAPKKFWPLLETLARTFFHNSLNEVNVFSESYNVFLDGYNVFSDGYNVFSEGQDMFVEGYGYTRF